MARAAVIPRFPGTLSPGLPIQALCRTPLSGAPATLPPSYWLLRCARRDRAECRPLRRDSRKRRPQPGYSIPAPPPLQRGKSKARPPPRRPAMAARIFRPPAPPASRLERGDILSRCGGMAPRYAPYTPRLSNPPSVAGVSEAPHTRPRQHTPIPRRYVSAPRIPAAGSTLYTVLSGRMPLRPRGTGK